MTGTQTANLAGGQSTKCVMADELSSNDSRSNVQFFTKDGKALRSFGTQTASDKGTQTNGLTLDNQEEEEAKVPSLNNVRAKHHCQHVWIVMRVSLSFDGALYLHLCLWDIALCPTSWCAFGEKSCAPKTLF